MWMSHHAPRASRQEPRERYVAWGVAAGLGAWFLFLAQTAPAPTTSWHVVPGPVVADAQVVMLDLVDGVDWPVGDGAEPTSPPPPRPEPDETCKCDPVGPWPDTVAPFYVHPGVFGPHSTADLFQYALAHRDALRACNPDGARGRVTVHLYVGADGTVGVDRADHKTLLDRQVSQCAAEVFDAMTFPAASRASKVSFPLWFGAE